MTKQYRESIQVRHPMFHVEECYTIFVNTGGGGYSYTYSSEEVLIKDMKEDPYISSNCYKKLKK